MRELLTAMRLPAEVIEPIAERAEGIPLYAVETVRMLIDRGALVAGDDGFQAVAEVGSPEIPETLHALVLARLDALPAADRGLLQDASVLGKTFTADGLAAVTGIAAADVASRLELLVRRELLSIDDDPRSPERGQFGFVQALVRTVAYETMSLRDRKRRHLAAAGHLTSIDQGDELVELVALHTLDAYQAVPGRRGRRPQLRDESRGPSAAGGGAGAFAGRAGGGKAADHDCAWNWPTTTACGHGCWSRLAMTHWRWATQSPAGSWGNGRSPSTAAQATSRPRRMCWPGSAMRCSWKGGPTRRSR